MDQFRTKCFTFHFDATGNIEIEIYGMEGIPPEDLAAHEANPGRAARSQSPEEDEDDEPASGPGPSTAPAPPGPPAPSFGGYPGKRFSEIL